MQLIHALSLALDKCRPGLEVGRERADDIAESSAVYFTELVEAREECHLSYAWSISGVLSSISDSYSSPFSQ